MVAKVKSPFIFAAALLVVASCSALKNTNDKTATNQPIQTERAVVLDFGSLDTLAELQLGRQIVAVPQQSLPEYLSHFAGDGYKDVGGLKSPDLDKVRQARPTVIVISGRHGDVQNELSAIAPTVDVSTQEDSYIAGVDAKVRKLAQHFGATEKAEAALANLHSHIDTAQQKLDREKKVLVVTHNDGNFMFNHNAVVHEVLQIPLLEVPESVPSETRGSRTFTPLSLENIRQMRPDVLLVVDRSAAIGNGQVADIKDLQRVLNQQGSSIKVVKLSPALWYLSGGGLRSLKLQVDEIAAAL